MTGCSPMNPTRPGALARPCDPVRDRATAFLCACLSLCLPIVGCSDKDRRLNPMEAHRYKMGLLRDHHREVAPGRAEDFLQFRPHQSEADIDADFDRYRAEFRELQEREAARFHAEREAAQARAAAEAERAAGGDGAEDGGEGDEAAGGATSGVDDDA